MRKRVNSDSMSGNDKEEHWSTKLLSTSGFGIGHGTGRVYPSHRIQLTFFRQKFSVSKFLEEEMIFKVALFSENPQFLQIEKLSGNMYFCKFGYRWKVLVLENLNTCFISICFNCNLRF